MTKFFKHNLVPYTCTLSRSCPTLCTLWTVACQAPLFSGKNTEVGCRCLLQGIFLTQGSNSHLLCLLHCRRILYHWATGEAHIHMAYVIDGDVIQFFFQFYWGIIDKTKINIKGTVWWFGTCIHCKMTFTIKLINTSSAHILTSIFVWWEHLRSTLLPNFKWTVSIINYSYHAIIRSSKLTHLEIESLHPFISLSLFPSPLSPGSHHINLYFIKFDV